jgi:hypothetical protein
VATYKKQEVFEAGLGIKFCRFVSAANKKYDSSLVEFPYNYDTTISVVPKSSGGFDTVKTYYPTKMPFSGTKVMARLDWHPLKTFNVQSDFFGKEDLRIYGEAAILGIKNYPTDYTGLGYNNLLERIPVMAGINLPTHPFIGNGVVPALFAMALISFERDSLKQIITPVPSLTDTIYDTTYTLLHFGFASQPARPFIWGGAAIVSGVGTFLLEKFIGKPMRFDVIALEVEYCSTPFNNNHDSPTGGGPVWVKNIYIQEKGRRIGDEPWHEDDWRWAVIAQKTLFNRLAISGKIASDHVRQRDPSGWYQNIERLYSYSEWYWNLNFNLSF